MKLGIEFSPFAGIALPERVNAEMESPGWSSPGQLQSYWKEAPKEMLPNYDFTIDGIKGSVLLFRGNPLARNTELPLGEVQTIESFNSDVSGVESAYRSNRIVRSAPLNFGVLLKADNLEDINKIANLIFEIRIEEDSYRLSFRRDIEVGFAYGQYGQVSKGLENGGYYSWLASSTMEKGEEFANVVLPYKKSALRTVKAIFLREETHQAQ